MYQHTRFLLIALPRVLRYLGNAEILILNASCVDLNAFPSLQFSFVLEDIQQGAFADEAISPSQNKYFCCEVNGTRVEVKRCLVGFLCSYTQQNLFRLHNRFALTVISLSLRIYRMSTATCYEVQFQTRALNRKVTAHESGRVFESCAIPWCTLNHFNCIKNN